MELNRLKVVLVERKRTGKWLAEVLRKNEATVSRWCMNESQPSLETLFAIAKALDVDVRELLVSTKNYRESEYYYGKI
ncbi:MAG: helix-turn-helix transcriptional regulator [Parabacteroides sp.]|nr:helix-turn-helix transcriptional regulator [Parabacteroides sp.]